MGFPRLAVTLVFGLAACGGDDGGRAAIDAPDAPDAPDAIDAADDGGTDAASAVVTVSVRQGSSTPGPDPTAVAIFTDAGGDVLFDGRVAADGTAAMPMPDGGTVTVIQHDSVLTTIRGVRPGDHLAIGPSSLPRRDFATSGDRMTAGFTYASAQLHFYAWATACDAPHQEANQLNPPGITIDFFPDCAAPTFDVLGIVDTSPPGFVWRAAIPHVASGTTTLPSTWTAMSLANLVATSVPAGVTRLELARWTMVHGTPLRTAVTSFADPSAGVAAAPLDYPDGAGDGTVFQSIVYRGNDHQEIDLHQQVAAGDGTIDLAAAAPPAVSNVVQTATGATWTETGGGAYDLRVVRLVYTADNVGTEIWTVVDDGATPGTLTVPALPAAHAALDPRTPRNQTLAEVWVDLIDYDNLAGYDAARGPGAELAEPIDQVGYFVTDTYRRAISHGQ